MSVARFTGAWSDTTEQTVSSAACRVTAIEIQPNGSQSSAAYLQLFNVANPTPGTTAPDIVIYIGTTTTQGLKRRIKVIFPDGGIRFDTACTAFHSTTSTGATAPLTTVLAAEIKVYYVLGN